MQIVSDELDGNFYIDIVLSFEDLESLKNNEMVYGETIIRKRKYYVGARSDGTYIEEEDEWDAYSE